MEIKFEKTTYCRDADTKNARLILNDISYCFESGKIHGVIFDDGATIGELLTRVIKPTSGYIWYNNMRTNDKSHIKNIGILKNELIYIPQSPIIFEEETVNKEIIKLLEDLSINIDIQKKVLDSLKLVGLDETTLSKNPNTLSFSNQKKLQLALAFCHNPKIIIFNNFEKGFNFRDRELLKKILQKLRTKYAKTIIFITNDSKSLIGLADNLIVIKTGKIVYQQEPPNFFDSELYKFISESPIIDFINYCQKKGHNIQECLDLKELIKAVYRDVK